MRNPLDHAARKEAFKDAAQKLRATAQDFDQLQANALKFNRQTNATQLADKAQLLRGQADIIEAMT